MGQQCSVLTCHNVEDPSQAEMSRVDSPDPVMYDLMRKSIMATELLDYNQSCHGVASSQSTMLPTKGGKRRPVGQSHLLYKNISKQNSNSNLGSNALPASTKIVVPTAAFDESNVRGAESGSHSHKHYLGHKSSNSSSSRPVSSQDEEVTSIAVTRCPTRLLIRRRSLRVAEEGGGTHIYAIRYPEDTAQLVVSEQAAPVAPSLRQEQCPPRKKTSSFTPLSTTTASMAVTNAASSSSSAFNTSKKTSKFATKAAGQYQQKLKTSTGTSTTNSDTNSHHTQPSTSSPPTASHPASPVVTAGSVETPPIADIFSASTMAAPPMRAVLEWVTVSDEHHIYVADVGLPAAHCDYLVNTTEQACRGTYAAYTYAKQTLGCREYPILAEASFEPVHTIVHAITSRFVTDSIPSTTDDNGNGNDNTSGTKTTGNITDNSNSNTNQKDNDNGITASNTSGPTTDVNPTNIRSLQLDDREPHIVKYDVSKKERQKLDMHTDKSEWTFLIALSNGCGVDYEGGGTYFECIDATIHIQRGHALVFPGKLRHCGQKITSGLRFLLVGFLVDKSSSSSAAAAAATTVAKKSSHTKNTAFGVDKAAAGTSNNPDASADGNAGVPDSTGLSSTAKGGIIQAKVVV